MKKLITLALIISITVISWSSCAKHTLINANNLYKQSPLTTNSILITPSLSNLSINENYAAIPNKTLNNHNFLFESTMIFNDKLQQFIAFFTNFHSDAKEIASNQLQDTNKNTLNTQTCQESKTKMESKHLY